MSWTTEDDDRIARNERYLYRSPFIHTWPADAVEHQEYCLGSYLTGLIDFINAMKHLGTEVAVTISLTPGTIRPPLPESPDETTDLP